MTQSVGRDYGYLVLAGAVVVGGAGEGGVAYCEFGPDRGEAARPRPGQAGQAGKVSVLGKGITRVHTKLSCKRILI